MRIGILSKNYAAKRLFLKKLSENKYRDVRFLNECLWRNAHLWFLRALGRLKMSPEEATALMFYDFKALIPTRCDLYHFFNCINLDGNIPWVVSVESAVPWPISVSRCVESDECDFSPVRNDDYVIKRMEILSKNNCLALLALSKCAANIQRNLLAQFPEYKNVIDKKLITLQPPQDLIVRTIYEKNLSWTDSEKFTFIYVGSNFYRKGGRESLEVLAELHNQYDFKLILISSMAVDEQKYILSSDDEEKCRSLIDSNKDWIEFYPGLPNSEVLNKMKESHVCLLPTWMDTYAFSVLESQACGTPVISTALRALNDINDNTVGWLIQVPVNRLNHPIHNRLEQRLSFKKQIIKGLKEKCEYVLTHRAEVMVKSEKCLMRIKSEHDPKIYAEKLRKVYRGELENL